MNARGGILPAALFLTAAVLLLAGLFSQLGAVMTARERALTAADFALLSALRVRADNLETIASRWLAFGGAITAAGTGLTADAAAWPAVSSGADALKRAISGFQGRITSAVTVALDANGFPRTATRATTGTGLRLGVTATQEPVSVSGIATPLPGAWYARSWSPATTAPLLTDGALFSLEWPVAWLAARATVHAAASGALEWDADPSDPAVAATGRGGFAARGGDAIDGAAFTPHRFPFFRAARQPEAG